MSRGAWLIGTAFGLGLWFVPRVFFDIPLEAMLAGLVAIAVAAVIGFPIGLLAGHFLARDADVDATSYRIVAGTNLVAWLVPIVGFTISGITWQFWRHSETKRALYCGLSNIGGVIALMVAGVGGIQTYMARQALAGVPDITASSGSTVHSTARCAYAAIEAWSDADFERYCRQASTAAR